MRKASTWVVLIVAVAMIFGVAACTQQNATPSSGTTEAPAKQLQIGVQSGTTGEQWAKDNLKNAKIVPFDDTLAAFSALQAGKVDAVVNDLPVSAAIVKDQSRGLKLIAEIPTGEQYGIGVAKSNPELLKAINWGLAKIKSNGEYDKVYKKWFGEAASSGTSETATPAAPSGAAPTGYKLVTAGTVVAGSDTAFPPFETMNGTTAEGFDVDLLAAVAKELGLKSEFKTYKFDTLIPTLKAGGKFDVIMSAMTINDDRKKEIDFSDPYIDSNQSVAVKNDSTLKSLADLQK